MGTHPIFESDFDCLTEWVKLRFTYYTVVDEVTNRNLKPSRLKFRTNFLPNSAISTSSGNLHQRPVANWRSLLTENLSIQKLAAMDMLILMPKSTKSLMLSQQPLARSNLTYLYMYEMLQYNL